MRIVIMYNPVSGAGRSAAAADAAVGAMTARGYAASAIASRLEPTAAWLDPALDGAAALVVAGGDGAMRLAAPAACRTKTPIFHLPLGTENLFAREFGMTRDVDALMAALERRKIHHVDVGVANGRWFLLMASVGFDAEVVHALAAKRGGSISHLTYIRPILASMRTWSPPRLSVEMDGDSLVSDEPGMVFVANSRQYGWRIDPAARAVMHDGLLDVVFLPVRSILDLIAWAFRCRVRRQFRHRSIVSARGRAIVVRCPQPQHFQLDGDPAGIVHEMLPEGFEAAGWEQRTEDESGRPLTMHVGVCPGRLPVLLPASGP